MQQIGKVIKLFISEKNKSSRTNKQTITLDKDGILDDKFYNTDLNRSVLITSTTSYDIAHSNDINIKYGKLGENLLIDYNPYNLKFGTKLIIGNTILEISQNCTICSHLSSIDKTLPTLLKNDRGIFAKVIQGGDINIDDNIYIS